MTPQELRNSILQLAIQGKLVPQRPEDGSAADLLREIQEQRERENVAASPKRSRRAAMETPAPVSPDEIPFDIPESWTISTLGDSCKMFTGNSISDLDKKTKYSRIKSGLDYISTKDITFSQKIIYNNGIKIPDGSDFKIAKKDSILLCIEGGSAGRKIGILEKDACFGNKLCMISPSPTYIENRFIFFYLQSPTFKLFFKKETSGIIGGVAIKKLREIFLPLPPLAEQKRIVAKIEELMPLVDRYEKAWNARKALDKRFPDDLQKSLLQLAIQGKLVPQNPADGNAEDLFRQIQEQRNHENAAAPKRSRRASAGTPAPVSPDEIPFDIPETWKWVKFVDAIKIRTNLVDPKLYPESIHMAPDNIEKGSGKILEFHSVREDKVKSANHFFKKGQILYSKIRPLLRKATIAPFDGLCSADMYPLETPHDKRFVLAYLLSDGFNKQVASIMSSRVKMPKINQEELSQVLFPLPPPAEQQRIAAKLADILPLCEKLSSHAN